MTTAISNLQLWYMARVHSAISWKIRTIVRKIQGELSIDAWLEILVPSPQYLHFCIASATLLALVVSICGRVFSSGNSTS